MSSIEMETMDAMQNAIDVLRCIEVFDDADASLVNEAVRRLLDTMELILLKGQVHSNLIAPQPEPTND